MTKITYLLGAGASYNACPIWKEQGERMVQLAANYFSNKGKVFNPDSKPTDLDNEDQIIWDIGYFGSKALKYGTVDTYAKKLHLNGSHRDLAKLKLAVSVFFTIWQLTKDYSLKSSRTSGIFDEIDMRYIALMASIIQTSNNKNNKINDNIQFVTWNYDLQLEFAFKSFCHDNLSWEYLSQDLKFRINDKDNSPLKICHLNGYHGFYKTENSEQNFLDLSTSTNINDILKQISYLGQSQSRGSISISDHINYAWESNKLSERARTEAKRIFSETDILIIIGYSFPNFNREIDKELFGKLKGRRTKIHYQDPQASISFIRQLVGDIETEITCENVKLDNFHLPHEF